MHGYAIFGQSIIFREFAMASHLGFHSLTTVKLHQDLHLSAKLHIAGSI